MPPYLREMPAWSAAALNVGQVRVTSVDGVAPDSTSELPLGTTALAPNRSLPVKPASTVAAAAENVLCPDTYSGNGGVVTSSRKYGSHASAAMSRVPWYGPAHAGTVCPASRVRTPAIGR